MFDAALTGLVFKLAGLQSKPGRLNSENRAKPAKGIHLALHFVPGEDAAVRCPYLLSFASANAVISFAAGILQASASSQ